MPGSPFIMASERYGAYLKNVSGLIAENIMRPYVGIAATTTITPTAGTLYCCGLIYVPANTLITGHGHWAVSAGSGATSIRWGALVRAIGNADGAGGTVAAVSANSTAAWTANTFNNITYASTYRPTDEGLYWACTVTTLATTQPTFAGLNGLAAGPAMQAPPWAATANTGLTATPLTVGTAIGARTAIQFIPYAYLI